MQPPHCPPAAALTALLLGQVSEAEAEQLERHLAECINCYTRLEGLEAEDNLLQTMRIRSALLAEPDTLSERLIPEVRAWRRNHEGRADSIAEGGGVAAARHDFLDSPAGPDELGRLGPYRVLRVLGRGGMGVVFEAEDTRLKRSVALKVILDARYADPRHLARFEREGEALARLRHPNVVQIYEVGRHRGRPYLALEYVSGGSLAQLPPGQTHPARDCAALITALARAVQHAHEQGVVHRDIKPGNVLLGPAGHVKLSDFDLAHRLDGNGMTETGELLGTPGYMAPEQVSGAAKDSGPKVDIYALGAVLYELLTGRPPFRGENALETLEQARTLDPVPPRRLRPGLPRDLETICLKCLEKDPRLRYSTAAALADDLDRFLQGRPILAQPVGLAGRLLKWAGRHPALAAVLALLGLSLTVLAGGAVAYEQRLRAALERTAAERERADANYREARDVLRKLLGHASVRSGTGIPRLEELRRQQQDEALAYFLKAAEQQGDDPEVRFDVAATRLEAGRLQVALGKFPEASKNFQQAAETLAALVREFPGEQRYRLFRAQALQALGSYGQLPAEERQRHLQQALELVEGLVRAAPGSVEYRSALGDIRINLGGFLLGRKDLPEAEELFRGAALVFEALSREQPEVRHHRMSQAKAHVNLSVLLQTSQRSPKESHDRAEQTLEQLHREKPDDGDILDTLAVLRVNWAYQLAAEEKPDAALADLAKNVTMLEDALKREPGHAILRDRLMRTHGVRAQVLEGQKRFAEAARESRRVVELAGSPAEADFRRLFLAMAHAQAGEHAPAVKEIDDWNTRTTPTTPSDQLLHCARVCCTAVEAVRRDDALSDPEQQELASRYATRALDFLRRVRKLVGEEEWKKDARDLGTDVEFRALWDHDEFRRLTGAS